MTSFKTILIITSFLLLHGCNIQDGKAHLSNAADKPYSASSSVLGLLYDDPEITVMTETAHRYGITKLERTKLTDSSVTYTIHAKAVWTPHGDLDLSYAVYTYSISSKGSISVSLNQGGNLIPLIVFDGKLD
jgi:hypothetical protein